MERQKLCKKSNGYSRIQYKENQYEKNPLKYRVKNIEKNMKKFRELQNNISEIMHNKTSKRRDERKIGI